MPIKPQTHAEQMRARRLKEPDDRPSPSARGYDWRWQKLRRMQLNAEPLCRACAAAGLTVPATDVDHIIAKAKGGGDGFDNLQSLCASCHSRKTALEDGAFGRPTT